jgi:hypothetical protein
MQALLISVPLMLFSVALGWFGEALKKFSGIDFATVGVAALALLSFGLIVPLVGPMIANGAVQFAFGVATISAALPLFALALQQFAGVDIGMVLVAVAALILFAGVMAGLVNTGLLFVMVAGFWLLAPALGAFGLALLAVGGGLALISQNMEVLWALSDMLSNVAMIGIIGAATMGTLAASILGIAFALMLVPEKKAIAFSYAMDGYGKAMASVAALTPDSVAAAEQIVDVAREYGEIQAQMKMPNEDAFVQALQGAFGGGEGKKKKGGQDVVLVINNREFGRAVDAAINSRHNLSID